MPSNWFIVKPDRELGPYTSAQMKHLSSSKQLKTDDLVRRADLTKTVAAGKVQGLFPQLETTDRPKTKPAQLPSQRKQSESPPSSGSLPLTSQQAVGGSMTTPPPLPSKGTELEQEWYYAKADQKHGPVTSQRFRVLAMSGALAPTDLVWTEGMSDWMKASAVKGWISPSQHFPLPLEAATAVKPPVPVTADFDHADGEMPGATPQQPSYCHWALLTLTTLICFPVTLILVRWKSTYSKRGKWAWTGACGLMFLAFVANGQSEREGAGSGNFAESRKEQTTSAPAAMGTWKVGDEFKLGDFKYKVVSTDRRSTVGDNQFFRKSASPGATFIVVSYTIENCSNESQTVMSDDFVLLDSSGRRFQPSSDANVMLLAGENKDFILSQLQPGVPRAMKTAFELPESAANSDMTLIVPEKGFFGSGDAKVKISGR